ncbi:hypothetical protein NIR10_004618 [Salmonella enterica]|nr:hypothetical protein [Salmonella enterica]
MVSFWNRKEEIYAELQRLRAIVGEAQPETSLSDNVDLNSENIQLRDLILNAQKPFYALDAEKRKEIDRIFDEYFDPNEPKTIYIVIGEAAAYILRGQLTA